MTNDKQKRIQDQAEVEINVEEKLAELDQSSNVRKLAGNLGKVITLIAIVMSLFHLYTAGFGILLAMKQRAMHLMFVFCPWFFDVSCQ